MAPRLLGRQVAAAIARRGAKIALRTVTGPPAGPIPPVLANPTVAALTLTGSTVMAINCSTASGSLSAGDQIVVNGQTVIVTAPVAATPFAIGGQAGFTGVSFLPALSQSAAAGTAVSFVWAADKVLRAIIGSYSLRVIDGENIKARDLRLRIAAYNQTEPDPATQKIVIGTDVRTIVTALPVYSGGELVEWDVQAR